MTLSGGSLPFLWQNYIFFLFFSSCQKLLKFFSHCRFFKFCRCFDWIQSAVFWKHRKLFSTLHFMDAKWYQIVQVDPVDNCRCIAAICVFIVYHVAKFCVIELDFCWVCLRPLICQLLFSASVFCLTAVTFCVPLCNIYSRCCTSLSCVRDRELKGHYNEASCIRPWALKVVVRGLFVCDYLQVNSRYNAINYD